MKKKAPRKKAMTKRQLRVLADQLHRRIADLQRITDDYVRFADQRDEAVRELDQRYARLQQQNNLLVQMWNHQVTANWLTPNHQPQAFPEDWDAPGALTDIRPPTLHREHVRVKPGRQ